jgi:hypothetical protein
MPQTDAFIERRTEALAMQHADVLTEVQSVWPQGTVVFADPNHLVLWVLPSVPMDESDESYDTLLEKVSTALRWACIAPDNRTLESALNGKLLPNATLHTNEHNVAWLIQDT